MTGGDGAPGTAPRCMACGRALRDEESQRLRLGPVCRKRLERLLVPRPRRIRTQTAAAHPRAVPSEPGQLELAWDDDQDDKRAQHITDVPTGALL